MNRHINIVRIKAVADALKDIKDLVVFVGGATVELYADKTIAIESRPTDDVDVIIELASYGGYSQLDKTLRKIGFVNDVESGVICRYRIQGIIVDVMPTDHKVIGFSNRWYSEGFKNAISYALDNGVEIKIFSLPYFIASKIEAFRSRGKNGYRTSKDFEDIVYIFDTNSGIADELMSVRELREYFKDEFGRMLNDPYLGEGIFCHLGPPSAEERTKYIIDQLKRCLY